MITWDQVVDLITFTAAFDQRKAGEAEARAWAMVAQAENWHPGAAQRVIVDHYRCGADRPRIEPNIISDRLREVRSLLADTFEGPEIPADLPNAEYPAWYRAQLRVHVDAALDEWAASGVEPQRPPVAPPVFRSIAELAEAAPEHIADEFRRAVAKFDEEPEPEAKPEPKIDPEPEAPFDPEVPE